MTDTPLPTGKEYPKDRLSRDFTWVNETPRGDGALAVKLLVPSSWQEDIIVAAPSVSTFRLAPLVLFSSPDKREFIQIQTVRLEREISAEHWLRYFGLVSDYTPIQIIKISPVFADSLCDFSIEGNAFRGRFAARIRGDLLFLISIFCPADRYAQRAEAFGVTIASFRPTSSPNQPFIEERKEAGLEDIVAFQYPASWKIRFVPPGPGKAAADLITLNDGQPTGLLRVKTTSKDHAQDNEIIVRDTLDEFKDAGFTPDELRINVGIEIANPRFVSGFLRMFGGHTGVGLPQELWIVVIEDTGHYVAISLLSPIPEQEYLIWAQNRRTLDIVTGSLS